MNRSHLILLFSLVAGGLIQDCSRGLQLDSVWPEQLVTVDGLEDAIDTIHEGLSSRLRMV